MLLHVRFPRRSSIADPAVEAIGTQENTWRLTSTYGDFCGRSICGKREYMEVWDQTYYDTLIYTMFFSSEIGLFVVKSPAPEGLAAMM